MVLGILKIGLRLRDWHVLCQNHWKFSTFSMFRLWNKFSEKRKPKNWSIAFLVELTKIETVRFSYKTVLSEANVKTNRMGRTKWTYHKERSFPNNYFIYLKILFQLKDLLQRVDLMNQAPKCPRMFFLRVYP